MNVSSNPLTVDQAYEFDRKNDLSELFQDVNIDFYERNKDNEGLHYLLQDNLLDESGVVELLKTSLNQGVDPNIVNNEGLTILHLAVLNRWRNAVKLLIQCKAKIDASDEQGNSTAHYFIEDERKKFGEFIKSERIDRDPSTINKFFNLFKTFGTQIQEMEYESAKYVEWLIFKGFDFDHRNKCGKSALHLSIEYNLHHISLALLEYRKNTNFIDENRRTLLHLFFEAELKFKSKFSYDQNSDEFYNWRNYNSRYSWKIVKILLEKGLSAVALDNQNQTPLTLACKGRKDLSIIETLIIHTLKKEEFATTVLVQLIESYAWWRRCKCQDFWKILKYPIIKGADVNIKDKNGMTSLCCAFDDRNLEAANFLNDHGANFDVITNCGENLFHLLAKRIDSDGMYCENSRSLFDLLVIKDCCDINAKNINLETPLHLALRHENSLIIRKLIESGVEVNCRNSVGQTPLFLAIDKIASQKFIEMWLQGGPDIRGIDYNDQWSMNVDKSIQSVPLLLKCGAYPNFYTVDNKSIM